MNKCYILGIAALAVAGLASCNPDSDPKIKTATEFKLNTPPMAEQTWVLTPEGTVRFAVSQPDYGLTLAPTYGIEVSLKEDFTPLAEGTYVNPDGEEVAIPAFVSVPLESQIRGILIAKESNLAAAICSMRGIGNADDFTEEEPRALYVRATSIVGGHPDTAITSNVVKLSYVKEYCALESNAYSDVLYTPGGANGWSFDSAMRIPLDPKGDGTVYKGFMAVNGDFKFTHGAAWGTPGNYGRGEADFSADDNGVWTGELSENGGNFNGPEAGLYFVTVTLTNPNTAEGEVAGSFTMEPIKTIGIIGNFNGWGGDIEMTPEPGFSVWKAENVDLGDGGWKFRMNSDWKYNLGGETLGDLSQDGANIPDGGTHTVILDLNTLPYSARLQ